MILKDKKMFKTLWKASSLGVPIFSYHLNVKINELKSKLSNGLVDEIKFSAKIYDRQMKNFTEITPHLINEAYICLN